MTSDSVSRSIFQARVPEWPHYEDACLSILGRNSSTSTTSQPNSPPKCRLDDHTAHTTNDGIPSLAMLPVRPSPRSKILSDPFMFPQETSESPPHMRVPQTLTILSTSRTFLFWSATRPPSDPGYSVSRPLSSAAPASPPLGCSYLHLHSRRYFSPASK